MRYIEVTHTYVVPVPVGLEEGIDTVANAGVSMMERFIKDRAEALIDLRSDWKMMPSSYRPTQPVPDLIEANGDNDTDEPTFDPAKLPEGFTDTPRERDRLDALKIIEADADQGVSLTGDIMGQQPGPYFHPWDQGVRVTPPGHDLFDAETEALRKENMLCDEKRGRFECVLVKGHPDAHLFAPTRILRGDSETPTIEP